MRGALIGKLARLGCALVLFVAVAFWLVSTTWLRHRSGWISGDGDPQLVMWDLAWTPFALSHLQTPLLTNYLVYPAEINLMWNTSDVLPSALLWPVTGAFGPMVSYNVLTTLTPALCAFCAYLALRPYAGWAGAMTGGLLYGFSPYVIAQLGGHPHASFAVFPPLVLLALDELFVRQRHSSALIGALLGGAAAAQMLTGIELLATTALMAAVATLVLVLLHPRAALAHSRHAVRGVCAAAGTAAVLSAYPMWVLLFGPNRVTGPIQTPDTYVTDLVGLAVPSAGQYFHTAASIATQLRFTGNMAEQDAYLGIPLISVLVVGTIALRRRPVVPWSVLVLVGALVFSMGPHLHVNGHVTPIQLPWTLLQKSTLFEAAVPARIAVFEFLMCAILIATMVDSLLAARIRALGVAGLVAVGLALLPLIPAGPSSTDPENPTFFTSRLVRRIPLGTVALVLPYAPDARDTLRAHLWQAESSFQFRMPEGEAIRPDSAGGPAVVDLRDSLAQLDSTGYELPSARALARLRSDLRLLQVRSVIIGPSSTEGAEVRLFEILLEQRGERVGGVFLFENIPS